MKTKSKKASKKADAALDMLLLAAAIGFDIGKLMFYSELLARNVLDLEADAPKSVKISARHIIDQIDSIKLRRP